MTPINTDNKSKLFYEQTIHSVLDLLVVFHEAHSELPWHVRQTLLIHGDTGTERREGSSLLNPQQFIEAVEASLQYKKCPNVLLNFSYLLSR